MNRLAFIPIVLSLPALALSSLATKEPAAQPAQVNVQTVVIMTPPTTVPLITPPFTPQAPEPTTIDNPFNANDALIDPTPPTTTRRTTTTTLDLRVPTPEGHQDLVPGDHSPCDDNAECDGPQDTVYFRSAEGICVATSRLTAQQWGKTIDESCPE